MLRLYGIKFSINQKENIAGQSYPRIWGNFGRHVETLDKKFFCNSEWPWIIAFYMHYDVWNSQNIGLAHILKAKIKHLQIN